MYICLCIFCMNVHKFHIHLQNISIKYLIVTYTHAKLNKRFHVILRTRNICHHVCVASRCCCYFNLVQLPFYYCYQCKYFLSNQTAFERRHTAPPRACIHHVMLLIRSFSIATAAPPLPPPSPPPSCIFFHTRRSQISGIIIMFSHEMYINRIWK